MLTNSDRRAINDFNELAERALGYAKEHLRDGRTDWALRYMERYRSNVENARRVVAFRERIEAIRAGVQR